jgi:hypothetical protein
MLNTKISHLREEGHEIPPARHEISTVFEIREIARNESGISSCLIFHPKSTPCLVCLKVQVFSLYLHHINF